MTLKNAFTYFESLITQTNKNSEIKIYREFIEILAGLENIKLSESELRSVERELDSLNLNSKTTNRKKYFNKALNQFKNYLSSTFSITTKGYYSNLGIALGSSFGTLSGIIFFAHFDKSMGIALGMALGMLIGHLIGRNLDAQAKAKGKMIF